MRSEPFTRTIPWAQEGSVSPRRLLTGFLPLSVSVCCKNQPFIATLPLPHLQREVSFSERAITIVLLLPPDLLFSYCFVILRHIWFPEQLPSFRIGCTDFIDKSSKRNFAANSVLRTASLSKGKALRARDFKGITGA
jgi:hypothetical protein